MKLDLNKFMEDYIDVKTRLARYDVGLNFLEKILQEADENSAESQAKYGSNDSFNVSNSEIKTEDVRKIFGLRRSDKAEDIFNKYIKERKNGNND